MKTAVVADAHLKGLTDPNQASLVKLLDGFIANKLDAIIILGDLFDFWRGFNQVVYHHYEPVLAALLRLKASGVKIIYFEGNHDFNMGGFFTGTLGAEVHKASCEMEIDGKIIFCAHGDLIAGGLAHKVWKGFVTGWLCGLLVRLAGPELTWKAAAMLSKKSRDYGGKKPRVESVLRGCAKRMIGKGADAVLLGHSHAAGVTKIEAEGRKGVYANPGSWAGDKTYLVHENGEFRVESG
ncbi:MAG: UDP-2,3-diacylglucosamine diphosphatase [Deltaproteobacteria bacterium]|nr:UDP-2,3-diacylglucosamine diphosphatase [Deltaproteobacteria bacterium]